MRQSGHYFHDIASVNVRSKIDDADGSETLSLTLTGGNGTYDHTIAIFFTGKIELTGGTAALLAGYVPDASDQATN